MVNSVEPIDRRGHGGTWWDVRGGTWWDVVGRGDLQNQSHYQYGITKKMINFRGFSLINDNKFSILIQCVSLTLIMHRLIMVLVC